MGGKKKKRHLALKGLVCNKHKLQNLWNTKRPKKINREKKNQNDG
jgi:hypothetical protein